MSKILIACAAADGHVNPFLPTVSHLLNCGHEIVWLCGRAYQEKIEAVGATFLGVPESFDPKGMDIYEFKPELKKLKGIAQIKFYIKTWCYDMAKPTVDIVEGILDNFEPDIYISDPMIYGPYIMAEKYNKPSINLHVIPLALSSKDHGPFGTGIGPTENIFGKLRIHFLNFIVDNFLFRDLKKHGNSMRMEMGLEPYQHIFDDFLKNTTSVLTTTVPGFDYIRSDIPNNIKYIGPILPKVKSNFVEPEWWSELQDDRPVILVNQGTIANDITELILLTIQALKDQNVLVIAVPLKEETKDFSANVKTAEFIPFANLLPFVDLMITNGGFGATHMALAHGIPIVCSGGSEDKMEVAARVAYSGCGVNIKKLRPAPDKIQIAVQEVLNNPSYKENAKRLQKEIRSYLPLEQIEKEISELTGI